MLFTLNAPEYTNVQSNTTKVKVHLKNGIAEILNQHTDLLGRVDNNIVEIETTFENKTEKSIFVVQDAVFVVSTKGLDKTLEKNTTVYVYAQNVKQINSSLPIDEITKQYEMKSISLETQQKILRELEIEKVNLGKKEDKKLNSLLTSVKSKVYLLSQTTGFLQKVLTLAKQLK